MHKGTGCPRKKYLSEILGSQIHVTIVWNGPTVHSCPNYPNGPIQSITRVQSGTEYGFVDLKCQKGTLSGTPCILTQIICTLDILNQFGRVIGNQRWSCSENLQFVAKKMQIDSCLIICRFCTRWMQKPLWAGNIKCCFIAALKNGAVKWINKCDTKYKGPLQTKLEFS